MLLVKFNKDIINIGQVFKLSIEANFIYALSEEKKILYLAQYETEEQAREAFSNILMASSSLNSVVIADASFGLKEA